MSKQIYGVFASKEDAVAAYHELAACHGAERCSVLVHEEFADATADSNDTRRSAVTGAAIVGTAGAVVSGLIAVGAGLLAVGPLVIAGLAVGSVYGALSGTLSGVADDHADRIEAALRDGKIVVAAEADDDAVVEAIQGVLDRHHGAVRT